MAVGRWPPAHRYIALQGADLHRLILGMIPDAGILAQDFDRADAGAHPAHDVGLEDRLGSTDRVIHRNRADEARHVDAGGAGLDAGRVITIETAAAFDERALPVQRWLHIIEIGRNFCGGEATRTDIWRGMLAHGRSSRLAKSSFPGRIALASSVQQRDAAYRMAIGYL